MKNFKSILIANRGEIALRVMRTASQMGLRTIAIYSEPDACAPHVRFADDSFLLGPAPASESYLRIDRILEAATATGADAIHPGYGFLSENTLFSKACYDAGVVFIGPSAASIAAMADKAEAKRRMIVAGVPCIPGYHGTDQSDQALLSAAQDVGFPLMVKAAAGGGGKGMRLVDEASDLESAIQRARAESENAFGSGDLILERAIARPRHVEIQVFGDNYGNVIHFGERDCSIQRRHQKVLEESPCPVMTDELRMQMGQAAVNAANAIDYQGAGTVEFLLDQAGNFYFLEMNTRLQVEHPVTEMVTGVDLVEQQIRVAQGHALDVSQDTIKLTGHAIEARLYAEDPANDFLPSTGRIELWDPPVGNGIRVDAGIESGGEVTPYYDPMLAKIVAYGRTRSEAVQKLSTALDQTVLLGPKSNRSFLIDCLNHETFATGKATTAFIAESFSASNFVDAIPASKDLAAAAVIQFSHSRAENHLKSFHVHDDFLNWSTAAPLSVPYHYMYQDDCDPIEVGIMPSGSTTYGVSIDDHTHLVEVISLTPSTAVLDLDGRRQTAHFCEENCGIILLSLNGLDFRFKNRLAILSHTEEVLGAGDVLAPMHGQLLSILVTKGRKVSKGDRLAVLEAMKMQHEIVATVDGTIAEILFEPNQQVPANALLIKITESD